MFYFPIFFISLFFFSHVTLLQASDYQFQYQTANTEYIPNLNDKLIENQTKSLSGPNAVQLTQAGRCPVSMPHMQSVVVLQSVEAPQIEPMNEQDYLPYNDYDLVMGKPAGILIDLNRFRMDKTQKFALAFTIKGDEDYRYNCFHAPFSGVMRKGQEYDCSFTRSELSMKSNFKFFPLPMNEKNLNKEGKFTVRVVLYPWGYSNNPACLKKWDFNMNIIKTSNLRIAFTRITGENNCSGYSPVSYRQVENFVESNEVKYQIQSMFPVRKVFSKVFEYVLNYKDRDDIDGHCDNSLATRIPEKISEGLLSDIDLMEHIRPAFFYDKLFAIVPESYFIFHDEIPPPYGLIVKPYWKPTKYEDGWWNLWGILTPLQHKSDGRNLGGSWNIAFIREDAGKRGTVSHELAHSLGQEREFYEAHEECQQFRKDPLEPCADYKIPLALDADNQSWKLIEKRYSIVSDKKDINNEWIDRDTYQKIFQVLSKFISPAIEPWVDLHGDRNSSSQLKDKEPSLKVVVSGFYYEKEDAFIVPKTRVYKTRLQTVSFDLKTKKSKLPLITFQLKKKDKVLKEVKRIALKMEIESLYENGNSKTRHFPLSHVIAAFHLPKDYKKRDFQITVLGLKKIQYISLLFQQ